MTLRPTYTPRSTYTFYREEMGVPCVGIWSVAIDVLCATQFYIAG